MTVLQSIAAHLPASDRRSTGEIDQEILDELEFHLEMRALENERNGMSAEAASTAAAERFGNFQCIRRSCRRIQLGERIMLQRVQVVLTVVLLLAVAAMAWQSLASQRANQAALASVAEKLASLSSVRVDSASHDTPGAAPEWAADRPRVVETFPAHGATDVDPTTAEIRVTFDKPMSNGSWSWVRSSSETFPETTGKIHYLDDRTTCVMPVQLKPGTKYVVWFNSANYHNFKDREGRPAVPHLLSFTTLDESP
jgi:hypothetical protein